MAKSCRDKPEKGKSDCKYISLSITREPCASCFECLGHPKYTPNPKGPEKVERRCSNCKNKNNVMSNFKHCGGDWTYPNFTPKEPPKPAEKPKENGPDYWNYTKAGSGQWTDISSPSKINKPLKKAKEKTMWKKIKHLIRMAGTCWLLYGIVKLVILVNPFIYQLWHLVPMPWDGKEMTECWGNTVLPWVFSVMGIVAICAFVYGLHKFTEFFFGERK